ncbi:hypothetical protein HY251_17150 [bacterium]|nr:hypothetical protein [bacterium]
MSETPSEKTPLRDLLSFAAGMRPVAHWRGAPRDRSAREAEFELRMAQAECCPIPGPCPRCDSAAAHLCLLGDILQWDRPVDVAVDEALTVFSGLPQSEAEGELLLALCRKHRGEAAIVLSNRGLRALKAVFEQPRPTPTDAPRDE